MNFDRTIIQNALVDLARGYEEFFTVKYDKATGRASVQATKAAPTSVLVNEVGCSFGPDRKMGRKEAQVRTGWRFEMVLTFDSEVTLDNFVDYLTATTLRPKVTGYSSVALKLLGYQVTHPPQQQPSSGTSALISVEAAVGRN